MIAAVPGLMFGLGLLLIWRSTRPRRVRTARAGGWHDRTTELLAQAGYSTVTPGQLVAVSAAAGLIVAVGTVTVSRSAPIALAFGGFAAAAPAALVGVRRRRRRVELRDLWPDVVDNLASGVRAGLSLPEALSQLGQRGPVGLREPFRRFAEDYQATGRFNDCLDRLKATLADPVADRIVESLRTAREVGGNDLGRLLRTLSAFLRDDARTRAELETRQGWTVNAARLAIVAPWGLLALMSLRPGAVAAYNTPAGVLVLGIGGGVSLFAYRLMLRIARLPEDRRVLP